MSKKKIIIVLAILIALTPFLGFPSSWEDMFAIGAGALIVLLSLDMRRFKNSSKKGGKRTKKTIVDDVYVENVPARSPEEFRSEARV